MGATHVSFNTLRDTPHGLGSPDEHIDALRRFKEEVIDRVYAWNERKGQFSERQIRLALRVLQEKGWLEATS